jgi:hypothetical protein
MSSVLARLEVVALTHFSIQSSDIHAVKLAWHSIIDLLHIPPCELTRWTSFSSSTVFSSATVSEA